MTHTFNISVLTDRQLSDRYVEETRKLKTLNRWRLAGSLGSRPCGYANTTMMNLCKRELERRGLPVPQVDF